MQLKPRKINLSYIAGLFDGEGCITTSNVMKYNPVMKKRYLCKTSRMELCNTDFGLVNLCYDFFKEGHICDIKPRKIKHGMSKPQKRWQLTHQQVYRVLKKLLPYLHNKDKIMKGTKIIKHYERINNT